MGAYPGRGRLARRRRRSEERLLPERVVETTREAVLAAAVQGADRLLLDRAAEVLLGLPDAARALPLGHVAEAVGPEAVEVGVRARHGLGAGRVADDVTAEVAPWRPGRAVEEALEQGVRLA